MKRLIIVLTAVFLLAGFGSADAAKKTRGKSYSKKQVAQTKDDFQFKGMIDVKAFNMTNAGYGETADWYFYPVYRAIVSKTFAKQSFTLLADVEKPGYANITYPFIKVNELYAKFQEDTFYVKLGRQIFGNKDDLLLGIQNDAVSLGFDLTGVDIMFFLAKTAIPVPWATGGTIDSIIGVVPTFELGDTMKLDAKLLIGNEAITVTPQTVPASPSEDKINTLVQAGGRFDINMPMDGGGAFDLAAQAGLQFAMARTATDNTIDATGMGLKLDAVYGSKTPDFGFNVGGHIVFTTGDPEPGVNTKAGFASGNILPEAGPGLFSKIENGAGVLTFLDGHTASPIINSYAGLFAFGITADIEVGGFVPGVGFWLYNSTAKDGKSLGMEINQTLEYKLSETVSFYQQLGYFVPNREGLEAAGLWPVNPPAPAPATPDPNGALKFLIGSAINF